MDAHGILPHQTVHMIVENVRQAQSDLHEAFCLLQGAKERLAACLGSGREVGYNDHLWSSTLSDYDLPRRAHEIEAQITRRAWAYLISHMGMQHYMTEARQHELRAQLDAGQFPVLTVDNVLSTLEGLTTQVGGLLLEFIIEVFDWLRPSPRSRLGQLKTNKQFLVPYTVIVGYAVEKNYHHTFRLNYHREANMRSLGNALALLDGRGVQRYPEDLVTHLKTALHSCCSGQAAEVPYMTVKPYGNGNLHIKFRRRDLIDKLNHMGSDVTLPGSERSI